MTGARMSGMVARVNSSRNMKRLAGWVTLGLGAILLVAFGAGCGGSGGAGGGTQTSLTGPEFDFVSDIKDAEVFHSPGE